MLMHSPLARDERQPPGFIRPCQPVLSLKVAVGDGSIREMKHDGFWIVAHKLRRRGPAVERGHKLRGAQRGRRAVLQSLFHVSGSPDY